MSLPLRRVDGEALGRRVVGCEGCGFVGFVADEACPACGARRLAPGSAYVADLEKVIPFSATDTQIRAGLTALRSRAWFADPGFDPAKIAVRPLWVPVWLVDATVRGSWTAEVGFDVEVTSSDEVLDGGRWVSREVTRTKVRWEPRLGAVDRRYDNAVAAAITGWSSLQASLGPFDVTGAVAAATVPDGAIEGPDVPAEVAWAEAEAAWSAAVGADCARATGAAHVRGVAITAGYEDVHATWALAPVGVATWTDEAGVLRVVRVHGVTGRGAGVIPGSWRRAWTWAAGIAAVGAALLVLGLLVGVAGVVLLPLLAVAPVLMGIGAVVLVAAVVPPAIVWATRP